MLKKGGETMKTKLCKARNEEGALIGCVAQPIFVADKDYLTDFCNVVQQGSDNEHRVRVWHHPLVNTGLCYFHSKMEKGLFNTVVDDYRS